MLHKIPEFSKSLSCSIRFQSALVEEEEPIFKGTKVAAIVPHCYRQVLTLLASLLLKMSSPRPPSTNANSKQISMLMLAKAVAPYAIYLFGFSIGFFHGGMTAESRSLEALHQVVSSRENCIKTTATTTPTATTSTPKVAPTDPPPGNGWKSIQVFYGQLQEPKNKNRIFYSQAKQDQIVLGLLHHKRDGFFVDLAANDAKRISNTYALERAYGWNGVCIEPNPEYWFDHARYRQCQLVAAIVGDQRMDEIIFNYRGVYGGIKKEGMDNANDALDARGLPLPAYTVPLQELLERTQTPRIIDYLSLDVEGAEYYVMQHFPFASYQIKIMTVERPKDDLKRHLEAHGFQMMAQISKFGETLWVHTNFLNSLDLSVLKPEAIASLEG